MYRLTEHHKASTPVESAFDPRPEQSQPSRKQPLLSHSPFLPRVTSVPTSNSTGEFHLFWPVYKVSHTCGNASSLCVHLYDSSRLCVRRNCIFLRWDRGSYQRIGETLEIDEFSFVIFLVREGGTEMGRGLPKSHTTCPEVSPLEEKAPTPIAAVNAGLHD